jgi:hypothetical protein
MILAYYYDYFLNKSKDFRKNKYYKRQIFKFSYNVKTIAQHIKLIYRIMELDDDDD